MDFIFRNRTGRSFIDPPPYPSPRWGRGMLFPVRLRVLVATFALPLVGCAQPSPPATAVADGGDAQRLVALVDYVGGDYAGAVQDGRVLDDSEYQEQLKFAADARALAKGLQADAPLLESLAEVEQLVRTKADPARVRKACRVARETAVARFGLETMPFERPNLVRAQALYAEPCATCHGATGNADTERARTLYPRPARFKDPRRLGELSPYRIYNTLTFGVPGTPMASFETLSPEQRWNLAFFVFRLGHEGDSVGRPAVPFAAAFLIYLREGIEAALLVGALLAGLRRLGRPDAARYIHAGWVGALPAGVATWWVLDRAISLGADQRELVESGVALLAAAVLFSVSFWMISKAESRHWIAYLRDQLERGLSRRSLYVLSGLAFLAVYREAAETILFTQALLLESEARRSQVWAGALAGVLAVLATALVMNRTVRRLPLGPFFAFSSLLLCGLAVSFAGSGIYGLVAAGYLRPRPVPFPEIPWMGIHPDLTALAVQLAIVLVIAAAGLATLLRRPETEGRIAS